MAAGRACLLQQGTRRQRRLTQLQKKKDAELNSANVKLQTLNEAVDTARQRKTNFEEGEPFNFHHLESAEEAEALGCRVLELAGPPAGPGAASAKRAPSLALRAAADDLPPLASDGPPVMEELANENIVKIVHAGGQDMEIMELESGETPANV